MSISVSMNTGQLKSHGCTFGTASRKAGCFKTVVLEHCSQLFLPPRDSIHSWVTYSPSVIQGFSVFWFHPDMQRRIHKSQNNPILVHYNFAAFKIFFLHGFLRFFISVCDTCSTHSTFHVLASLIFGEGGRLWSSPSNFLKFAFPALSLFWFVVRWLSRYKKGLHAGRPELHSWH